MKRVRLGDVADVEISGIDKKTKEGEKAVKLCNFVDVYYNWAITKNMYEGLMLASASNSDIESLSLHKGQVAITKDSETRDDIGVAAYIADDFDDVVLGYHCALITPKNDIPEDDRINGKYLNALLHTKYAQKHFSNNATGSGQRYTLSKEAIEDMILHLPSPKEQERIGNYLSDIDHKIELNNLITNKLEDLTKQIYDYWFVQYDFPNEEGKPYKSSHGKMVWNETLKQEIPEGWSDDTIDNLTNINDASLTNEDIIKTIDYLDTSNLNRNCIGETITYDRNTKPSRAQRKVKDKTILFSTVRPALGHYGILLNPPSNIIVSTGFATLDAKDKNDAFRIYMFLTSDYIVEFLAKLADTAVTSYPSINPSDIGSLSIVVPPPVVVNSFNSIIEDSFNIITKNSIQIKQLQSLREYLLPLLMNGQVTIKE